VTRSTKPHLRRAYHRDSVALERQNDSILSINDESVTWGNLRPRLAGIYKERAEKVAFVRADSELNSRRLHAPLISRTGRPWINVGLLR